MPSFYSKKKKETKISGQVWGKVVGGRNADEPKTSPPTNLTTKRLDLPEHGAATNAVCILQIRRHGLGRRPEAHGGKSQGQGVVDDDGRDAGVRRVWGGWERERSGLVDGDGGGFLHAVKFWSGFAPCCR
jgi:hypothetical protein